MKSAPRKLRLVQTFIPQDGAGKLAEAGGTCQALVLGDGGHMQASSEAKEMFAWVE